MPVIFPGNNHTRFFIVNISLEVARLPFYFKTECTNEENFFSFNTSYFDLMDSTKWNLLQTVYTTMWYNENFDSNLRWTWRRRVFSMVTRGFVQADIDHGTDILHHSVQLHIQVLTFSISVDSQVILRYLLLLLPKTKIFWHSSELSLSELHTHDEHSDRKRRNQLPGHTRPWPWAA